jgi:hypothetical protein
MMSVQPMADPYSHSGHAEAGPGLGAPEPAIEASTKAKNTTLPSAVSILSTLNVIDKLP